MNNPAYLVPRLVRHFLPEWVTRYLLLRSLIIKPSLETADPAAAVDRYGKVLAAHHDSLRGKRVFVLGYGGRFDVGIGLLDAGASHVTLCERYTRPEDTHNRELLATHADRLCLVGDALRPRPEEMELLEADVRAIDSPAATQRYDLVISNSVYEHLEDAEGVTRALARWTTPSGVHIHFVDLRDHYFKYPFEMLRYSEETWRRWLNPVSNLNRLRMWDYRRIFESHFRRVEINVLERDDAAFAPIKPSLKPEFVSGDPTQDSVTLIQVSAMNPRD
jgi:SAM-dependent methyltransferase